MDIRTEVDSWKALESQAQNEAQKYELKGTPVALKLPDGTDISEIGRIGLLRQPLRIVGIRLSDYGRVVDFDAQNAPLQMGDAVVVEAPEKGLMVGWVSRPPLTVENAELRLRLPPLVRVASEEDLQTHDRAKSMGDDAVKRTQAATEKYRLRMTILRVTYSLDLRRAIVYFSADERVDFRDLLRELVHLLRARVELRQVGARDQSKLVGGIGPCGQELCCSRHLNKFHNVTIKMAKDQDLSLKPTRVTGMCGRLKCCLAYEESAYLDARKSMPRKGKCVSCKLGGCGVVRDVNYISAKVTVELEDGGIQVFPASEVMEERTMKGDFRYKDEQVVASSDDEGSEEDLKGLED